MKTGIVLAVVAMAALAGCERDPNRLMYDGFDFRAKAGAQSDDKRQFIVSVPGAQVMPSAARKAAAHEAVQYCLKHFGGTDMTWADTPEVDAARLLTPEGVLVRQGRCDFR